MFLESHPELTQPSPSEQGFSLHQAVAVPNNNGLEPSLSAAPLPITIPLGQPENLIGHLLIVYNQNDPDSKDLAFYYAAKRDIAADHILPIACSIDEEINRAQYNETIREPIISYLCQKNWITRQSQQVRVGNRVIELLVSTYNNIWAIVLIRGVPLKISPDSSDTDAMEAQPALATNAAAVDNELALLPIFGLPLGGIAPNPFYDASMTGLQRAGPEMATKMILVTRLDGPKPSDVRRMIDDSLYAEKNRLTGLAAIDARGITDPKDAYIMGDVWLRHAHDLLTKDGWSVKFDDKSDLIPDTDPCNQIALYLGWYRQDAIGPWVTPPNRFVPGAIAYHLHSFSASTVRSETNGWVGPLISHGAAATMGTVYEPYLEMTPHLDIFTKRLLDGNCFAEAAYASIKGLSWMTTVVGDPLYRPFRQSMDNALADPSLAHSDHHDWLLLQQVQRALAEEKTPIQTTTLEHALNIPGAGAFAQEGLGDLLEKLKDPAASSAAEKAYKKAIALDAAPIDQIRVGLKLAQHYATHGKNALAETELKSLRDHYPQDAQRFGVIDLLTPTLTPSINPVPVTQQTNSVPKASPPVAVPAPPRPPLPPKP